MTLRSLDNIRWALAALFVALSVALLVGLSTDRGVDARYAMIALGALALGGLMAPIDTYIARRDEARARERVNELTVPKRPAEKVRPTG